MKYCQFLEDDLRLVNKLGEGEFGEVHMGLLNSGDTVAVKKLKVGGGEDERDKMLKEAFTMAQFSHPNIVRLIGITQVENVSVCV